VIHPVFDQALAAQIGSALDLRQPNADALETIAKVAEERLAADGSSFEGVVDVATGVGKTYVLAAAIDYFTGLGYRDFAVITPGRTIARKTIANFSPGHPKSLLGGMETQPRVITSENFASPDVARVMDDPGVAKIFIFTVQALLTPSKKADRKTHEFQEALGEGFYEKLASAGDLVLFADEHHVYGGKKFDAAVRGLRPRMLLGLTATPLKAAPVIYRFPLPAAIAGGYVKTPVMVGRRDDRKDFLTKLTDGARLLDAKQTALDAWRTSHPGLPVVHAVMLVIARNTEDANEAEAILRHANFHGGSYTDATLTIHSAVADVDKALAELDEVEDPDSEVRAIVSVGMLKEGWDVRNVYVICSLRASVSEILTEQTLGRGLRLPFGKPTGNEMLDTLEVVAHDRFEALVDKVDRLREEFVDWKTLAAADAAKAPPISEAATIAGVMGTATKGATTTGTPVVTDTEDRIAHNDTAAAEIADVLAVRPAMPKLLIPVVTSTPVDSPFGLQDIIDFEPFRAEGRRFAANPEDQLRRTVLDAKVVETEKGKTTQFIRRTATDKILSAGQAVSDAELVARLTADVLIAVDTADHHWVIEGKADDAAKDADVVAKRAAATRWAAHVTANTGVAWHYLFARETDIETAKSSWEALKKLAGA
jgi:type III restriction enzyme